MAGNWQPLSRICNSLGLPDHPLYRALAHADHPKEYRLLALESALRSGAIPMLGCRASALGLEASERIEAKIDADTGIDISLDEVTLRRRYSPEALEDSRDWPVGVIDSSAPEWMSFSPEWSPEEWEKRETALFGEVLAERKLGAERRFGARLPVPLEPAADHCLDIARFRSVEADTASVEQCLRETILPALPPASPLAIGASPPPRKRPRRSAVEERLLEMYPEGVPPAEILPNFKLLARCRGPGWPACNDKTIPRAAARIKQPSSRDNKPDDP